MNSFRLQQDYFEASADRSPGVVAVDDHGERLTYEALEARANQIAALLRDLGAAPNERVCLLTGKNANAYAGILAILKSGACWVPLSTAYPEARLKSLIEALRPTIIIVEDETLELAQRIRQYGDRNAEVVLLGSDAQNADVAGEQAVRSQSTERVRHPEASPEDLAYIIYTSGSTGTPKGVMVLHRNTTQFLDLCPDFFGIEPKSRFAHFSDLTFDPSVFDLFHCWQTGGTLVPFNRRSYRINPGKFLIEQNIDVLFTVPSVVESARDAGHLGKLELASLKHLLLTGEAITAELVRAWYDAYPKTRIYNLYGTTETAIVSHWCLIPPTMDIDDPVPVGQVLPGTRILLMDGACAVDDGEVGESIVYGSQLSPGYWASSYQTAAAFVAHPLDPDLPQTVYRTGDLLKKDGTGTYYYVGRADTQVKVRGHRIELGEVESILRLHDRVRDAVVVNVRGGKGGYDNRLVAFVRAEGDEVASELDGYLVEKVPSYMVPSRVVPLVSDFPRNSNGKIDRVALSRLAFDALNAMATS